MKLKFGKISRTKKNSPCPNCGKELNSACGLDSEDGPSPGDFTVCIGCGYILAFTEDLGVRELTGEEAIEAAGREEIVEFNRIREGVLGKKPEGE